VITDLLALSGLKKNPLTAPGFFLTGVEDSLDGLVHEVIGILAKFFPVEIN
jgi:hypothetical protein